MEPLGSDDFFDDEFGGVQVDNALDIEGSEHHSPVMEKYNVSSAYRVLNLVFYIDVVIFGAIDFLLGNVWAVLAPIFGGLVLQYKKVRRNAPIIAYIVYLYVSAVVFYWYRERNLGLRAWWSETTVFVLFLLKLFLAILLSIAYKWLKVTF